MNRKIYPGTMLLGFCGGWFGRDAHGDKRVEGVGADWIVARSVDDQEVVFASGDDVHEQLAPFVDPD